MFTKIDELIWTDDKYKKLSDDGKFLFLYVLSCPHRNILGFYFLPVPYGAFDLDWKSERFTKGLRELLAKGLISYNFNTNIIFIKNFLKYNPLENPNQVKGAIKALNILPTNGIDADLVRYLESINKPFMEPLLELLGKRLGKHVDVDVDVDVDVNVKVDEIIMTPYESSYIKLLEKIKDYPLDRKKDLEYMKQLEERYPTLDLIQAMEKFSTYVMDKPFKKNANHRSQLNTSFGKYVEWGNCIKTINTSSEVYTDENPFVNRS